MESRRKKGVRRENRERVKGWDGVNESKSSQSLSSE